MIEFQHGGIRFQVIELPTLNRVQLWMLTDGAKVWEVGHGKDIPTGRTAKYAAVTMKHFITGVIGHDEYNHLLPA
jgi:hypothetical protein